MVGLGVCPTGGVLPATGSGGPGIAILLICLGVLLAALAFALRRRLSRRNLAPAAITALIVAPLGLALPGPLAVSADSCANITVPDAGTFAAKVLAKSGGEPNISISPSGRYLFADGLGGAASGQPANIFRSSDYGATFQK